MRVRDLSISTSLSKLLLIEKPPMLCKASKAPPAAPMERLRESSSLINTLAVTLYTGA